MKVEKLGKKWLNKGKDTVKALLFSAPKKAQVLDENNMTDGETVSYVLKTGDWVKENTKSTESEHQRQQGNVTGEATLKKTTSLAGKTRAKEAFLEQCLSSGEYTEQQLLVVQNPYLLSPLTALILFQSEQAYRVEVQVKGHHHTEDTVCKKTDVSGMTEYTTRHRIPVIGLYPDMENQVILHFFDENGTFCKGLVLLIPTMPLPDGLKNMIKIKDQQKTSAFGLTFVYGGDTRFPYAFDENGDIRFYIARQPKPYGLHFLSDGHFLFAEKSVLMPSFANPHSSEVLEMDLLGRVHRIFHVENGLHHDVSEMTPGGNLIAAGSSLKHSNEDMVLELDRKTGKVVTQVKLGDVFDKTYQDGVDWVHLNTVSYDAKDNSVLICCRNLHTVAKIDWETGKFIWILCHPKFWAGTSMEDKLLTPVGKELKKKGWFYQAHAAYFLEEDMDGNPDTRHLIIYDNHWHKRRSVSFFDEDPHSFVRIYEINEKERTVSLWKSFACAKSKIRSNGILCSEKNRLFAMSGFLEPPVEGSAGMINEYDFFSGKLLNQYLTRSSFYRAYELPVQYADLARTVAFDTEYRLGEMREPYRVQKPDIAHSIPLPKKDVLYAKENKYYKGTKAERKKKYEAAMESGEMPFDIEQDIANTEFSLCENVLYIGFVDHLIQRIYFVGENECYVQDYSDTTQTNPALFARLFYSVTVPLGVLAPDRYRIYLECDGKYYDSGQMIEIKQQKK